MSFSGFSYRPAGPAPLGVPAQAGRCLVMGILNVTPDSFSDGGRWLDPQAAVAHAHEMIAAGADIIDIGGQSTRPGAADVSWEVEWLRIGSVVTTLAAAGVPLSVDTMHAQTAARAADAGALIINDVSGGLADPQMVTTVAATSCAYVCQHWRGDPRVMDSRCDYPQGVNEGALGELSARIDVLVEAGIAPERIVIDPGIGFAKSHAGSWEVLASIDEWVATGFPVLVGASRKRFLDLAAPDRDAATVALTSLLAVAGVWAVRVHDVGPNSVAVAVAQQWKEHA